MTAERLLALAAAVERGSEHPLGPAIVGQARERARPVAAASEFRALEGLGVEGVVAGARVVARNLRHLEAAGIDAAPLAGSAEKAAAEGKTVAYVAVAGRPAGLIALADTLKPSAREAVGKLQRMGLRIVMLTGDNARTARALSSQAGIAEVFAEAGCEVVIGGPPPTARCGAPRPAAAAHDHRPPRSLDAPASRSPYRT